jgi:SOH1
MDTDTPQKEVTKLPENRFELELEFGMKDCFDCDATNRCYKCSRISCLLLGHNHTFSVQSLASPAYLHYLATNTTEEGKSLLLDDKFKAFLRYLLATWSHPQYARFIKYPHSLYFLDLLIKNDAFCRELAQVNFRNFCHQQQ